MKKDNYISRLLRLILPFGRRRLAWVLVLSILQGVFQALSVFSILPFLAFATNPDSITNSKFYKSLEDLLPFFIKDNLIVSAGVVLITLIVISNIINVFSDYYRQKYTTHTAMEIGTALISIYAYQPYTFHLSNNSGELIKRIQGDVNRFLAGGLMPFITIISNVINISFVLLVLIFVDWQVILFAFIFFAILVGFSNLGFSKRLVLGNLERKEMESKRYQTGFQLLTGIKSVTIHNAQQYFLKNFRKYWEIIAKHDTFLIVASNGPRYLIEAISFSGIVILVLYLNSQNKSLESILPTLALFVMAAYRILPSFQVLNAQFNQIKSFKYTVDILTEDFKDKQRVNESESDSLIGLDKNIKFEKTIGIANISYQYPGASVSSLNDISFEILKGQRIGIIGTSGAGKSTFVDLVLGLLTPSSGTISIDGVIMDSKNISAWRKKIGYVPQDIFLIDDTVTNNIAFGVPTEKIDVEKVKSAAKLAQIHDFIESTLSHGYATVCGDRGVKLSGGQRQRIVLARALYHEPEVLIFDEATSALDNETEKRLLESIESLPADLTIIQVAHRLETIKKTNKVFVFEKGIIVWSGTFTNLNRQQDVKEHFIKSESNKISK